VAFQLLRYKVRIWEEEQRKTGTISPIVGIVVYHGVVKWTVPQTFAPLLRPKADKLSKAEQQAEDEEFERLRPYLPDFTYRLVDLSAMTDEEIQGEVWLQIFRAYS
jgi:Putative transposase, YhgA-like